MLGTAVDSRIKLWYNDGAFLLWEESMSNIGWLFGWAKEQGIQIPLNGDGSANIPKLLDMYNEWRKDSVSEASPIPTATKFNRLNTKNHRQHAQDLGYDSQSEYENAATEFFNSGRGKIYYSNARSRYYRYDSSTGEFAVSSNGVIHTYYKVTKKKFDKIKRQDELNEV